MAQKLPRALTEGLKTIRVGLLRDDCHEAYSRALAERDAELSRRLEILREWYGIASGPDCWRDLCLAMAAERFPGFREKAGRKPPKWTQGVLAILAGEMRRAMDDGAATQEDAARKLASEEPWSNFLGRGRWAGRAKPRDRSPWENLLSTYAHMAPRYRKVGELAYQTHRDEMTLAEWERLVRDFLGRPSA